MKGGGGGGGGVKYGIGLFKWEEEWLILFWTKFFKMIIYSRNKFAAIILSYLGS